MAKKKKFTSEIMPEFFYSVVDEFWFDDDTYVIIFKEMVDADGDVYHLDVEYHKDEDRITYTRVYDYDTLDATEMITPCFKEQFDNYILKVVK